PEGEVPPRDQASAEKAPVLPATPSPPAVPDVPPGDRGGEDKAGKEVEGPQQALTLDRAIDRLLRDNLDVRARFDEITQAQADIQSAAVRANPLILTIADRTLGGDNDDRRSGVSRPGVVIIQPVEIGHQRVLRTLVALRAK